MASWYSKLLTTTTSQISNLQSRLLQSENDGDTEDDTHVCRVLRGYYTEQGKPFPGWLPPDPKAPPPVAPTYSQPQVGSRYGRTSPQQAPAPGNSGPAPTGLSSLWGDNRARAGGGGQQPQQQQQQGGQGQSLRAGGNDAQSRLPSQRGGGYQQNSPFGRETNNTTPSSVGSGGASAQDKLKQRLWGGGARTTSPSSGSTGPFQPPGRGGGGGGGGGGYSSSNRRDDAGDYETRFAPGGMYDSSSNRGGSDKPFMAANSPWASTEDEFMGGGRPSRSGGLPSGPRRGAGGLPSGPRMR